MIKKLLNRAYHISENYHLFDIVVKNIKQTLVNNNFPIVIRDKTINKFLANKSNNKPKEIKNNTIKI